MEIEEIEKILNLALIREQSSKELYVNLLETYRNLCNQNETIKDLFTFLINEKTRYIDTIKEKINSLCSEEIQ